MTGSGTDRGIALPFQQPEPSGWGGRVSRINLKLVLPALLGLCVLRAWLMPLPSSMWVDEMATSFVVRYGATHPSLQVALQVPASIYYGLPALSDRLFGLSEIAYRVPSVVAMLLALWLIARMARVLIHPDAAWFVVFACLALREFDYQAADARPYALGTLVLCVGLWFLIRWLDSTRWLDALLFIAAGALLWRVHLVFWPFYLLFAFYALVRLVRADTRVGWLQASVVFGLLGVSLLPVLGGALAIYRQAGAHVVVPPPTGADLANALKPALITAMCALAALMSRWFRWPRVDHIASPAALSLIFGWWLCDPLCLFAFSKLTGNSVFLSRYLYLALPGAALVGTVAAAAFIPPRYWKPVALIPAVVVLLTMGHWNRIWPAHHNSDWRAAGRAVNALGFGPDVPIICPSPFIEARVPVWRPDYPITSFLYSHLLVYRMHGREYPFPFESSPEAESFAARLSQQTLTASPHFILFGGDRVVTFWSEWFRARPELAAWHMRQLGAYGDVSVVVFDKPKPD